MSLFPLDEYFKKCAGNHFSCCDCEHKSYCDNKILIRSFVELDLREKVIMKLAELVDSLRDSQWFPDAYAPRRLRDNGSPEQVIQQAVKEVTIKE